jgi:hypothetical protein
MQAVCGDRCVDVSTVRRWVRQFKDGELGPGRPVTASDQPRQDGGSVLKCVFIL